MRSSTSTSTAKARTTATTSATTVEVTYQELPPVALVTVAISLAGLVIGLNQLNPWLSPLVLVTSLMGIGGLLLRLHLAERTATKSADRAEDYAKLAQNNLAKYEPWLNANIRGQNEAVGAVVASLHRELSAVMANVSDGDTIMLQPGEYKGELTISKSVHVIGVTDQNGASGVFPVIHGSLADSLTITGSRVVLENVVISQDTPGNLRGVFVDQEASLEMVKCTVQARSKFGVAALKQGKIVAHDSTFETYGAGSGVTIEENGRGTLERCTVTNNTWGAVCAGSAKVELTGCIFRQNGTADGAGCTVEAYGGHTQVEVSRCQFQENAATAWADESGTLNITDSTFEGNGLTGDAKFAGRGLVCSVNSGAATISNCAFDRNKQGVVATNGGKMQIVGCKFDSNGLITQNQSLYNFTFNVYVFGSSAAMTISNTPFTNVVNGAMYSVEGGQLNLENCAIQGGVSGLQVGFENEPASASLRRVEFSGQSSFQVYVRGGSRVTLEKCRMLQGRSGVDGLLVRAGGKVEVLGCEFLEAGSSGLEADGPNTEITVRDSRFAGNQGSGLLVSNQATLAGSDCLVEGNLYGVQAGVPNARNSAGAITLERSTVRSNRYWGVGALARSTIVLRDVSFAGQLLAAQEDGAKEVQIEAIFPATC